jgi:thioesterase domain-containing protein
LEVDYQPYPRRFDPYDISVDLIEAEEGFSLVARSHTSEQVPSELHRLLDGMETLLSDGSSLEVAPPELSIPEGFHVQPPIVVTLAKGDPSHTPLLCLLGIQLYYDLAQLIGHGTPVIGIHIPLLHDPRAQWRPTLRQVSELYVRVVRDVQPTGPYRLAGLCLGGIVAYDVATLLQAQGEEVSFVAMFDALLPNGHRVDPVRRLLEWAGHPFRTLRRLFGHRKAGEPDLPKNISHATDGLVDLPFGTPGAVRGIEEWVTTQPWLDGHLISFQALKNGLPVWDHVSPDLGWSFRARSTEFLSIPSDHLEIVRPPHVAGVAKVINRELGLKR